MAHLLDPTKVVSRSNSDLTLIDMILNDRYIAGEVRMDLIREVVAGWSANCQNNASVAAQRLSLGEYFEKRRVRLEREAAIANDECNCSNPDCQV